MIQNLRSYRIIAVTLALLMTIMSVGYSFDLHYCQGQVKSISFLGEAKQCHAIEKESHCNAQKSSCSNKDLSEKDDHKDCCSNKRAYFNFDIEYAHAFNHVENFQVDVSLVAPLYLPFVYSIEFSSSHNKYLNYIPPPLESDKQILYQCFLL